MVVDKTIGRLRMKVLLIAYDNDSYVPQFPLGLAYIASAIRNQGHQVEIYQQDIYHYTDKQLTEHINKTKPDVVGIGMCGGYYQYKRFKEISNAIGNAQHKPIFIAGGHMFSPEPRFFLENFNLDYVIIGEGEQTIAELLTFKNISSVKGIAYLEDDLLFIADCLHIRQDWW